ncbi:MAG: 4-(cytidine 5'-diphospho)-2-C-methyl-D-erythritol kinase [Candidatus Limnocylindria bacterium]
MTQRLRLAAPAKLNLRLSVVGRREGGFHLLDSTFVLVDLADELELTTGTGTLECSGPEAGDLAPDRNNLAWRGLRAALGDRVDEVGLTLRKLIPLAAGLGGGSSDAAAAWRLGHAWRDVVPRTGPDDRTDLGRIGADVPFFAAGLAAARVTGIGEQVESLPAEIRHIVLVHPPFGLSTGAVFGELRQDEWGRLENDLLAPARRLRPELDDLFARVSAAGGKPKLTGSGPTIFSSCDSAGEAVRLAEHIETAGLRASVTRTRGAAASIERISEEG